MHITASLSSLFCFLSIIIIFSFINISTINATIQKPLSIIIHHILSLDTTYSNIRLTLYPLFLPSFLPFSRPSFPLFWVPIPFLYRKQAGL
ncbi:hypothetical protein CPC08DRAFT_506352 [Agrocybe pediades]|nr:hypothetical protein CPC08DRAFT_506352 [Agrocybe pediades]